MPDSPTIHLIFKTHLDLGFTDYAANVATAYFERFIPQAVALAQRTRERGEQRFRWTTGAWLIYEYLERASETERKSMEQAIAAGDILWHALPFTTHTELMDETLFRFGLGYAQQLDWRFGRKTVAAKMTDVPGHTRSMVPLLAEAGIKLLHIGVNPTSSVPEVPPIFLWRDEDSGSDLVVIYHETYGGVTTIPGSNDALAMVLTGDNEGPPSDAAIAETYRVLQAQMLGADVIASTLDDFAHTLDPVRSQLPVITAEIGDTWIHGAGTDPTKVRHYRELSRLRRSWLAQPLCEGKRDLIDKFSRSLIMIPEHTWGMDEKTHLLNHTHYEADDLKVLRESEQGRRFEASWAEQRRYLTSALEAIHGTPLADEAAAQLAAVTPTLPDLSLWAATTDTVLRAGDLEMAFNPVSGALIRVVRGETALDWIDRQHPLGQFTYEAFGQDDYDRHWLQYNRNREDPSIYHWAIEDFTKPGQPNAQHAEWHPTATAIYRRGDSRLLFVLSLPPASERFGSPERLFLEYRLDDAGIDIRLSWFNKRPSRMAEAFWLSFSPNLGVEDWCFEKMGCLVDPTDVVSKGARTLHAVDQRVSYDDGARRFELTTLDAPLVAPGARSLLNFHNQVPDMRGGVHVNLYNNIWGTNFPMWFDEDALFRFRVTLK